MGDVRPERDDPVWRVERQRRSLREFRRQDRTGRADSHPWGRPRPHSFSPEWERTCLVCTSQLQVQVFSPVVTFTGDVRWLANHGDLKRFLWTPFVDTELVLGRDPTFLNPRLFLTWWSLSSTLPVFYWLKHSTLKCRSERVLVSVPVGVRSTDWGLQGPLYRGAAV